MDQILVLYYPAGRVEKSAPVSRDAAWEAARAAIEGGAVGFVIRPVPVHTIDLPALVAARQSALLQ